MRMWLKNLLVWSILSLHVLARPAAASEPDIQGYWEGAFVRGDSAQVIKLHVAKGVSGHTGRLESPDLPLTEAALDITTEGGSVRFDTAYGKAVLALDPASGELVGTVGDATPPIRVHLKRALKPTDPPIRTEEVEFRSGGVVLSGTLVLPESRGPHPAVVFIHGRGKSTRNGYRAFSRILAVRGVASLIYDKRGVGKSTGDHDKASLYDLADDAMSAVNFLAGRADIDAKQIGLHGMSAGGWVAAIVTTRSRTPLSFVITQVGPAESVRDQQIHVAEYSMRQSGQGFTEEEIASAKRHMGLVVDFAYTGQGWGELQASVGRAKNARWSKFVDLPESESYADIQWVRLNQYDPGPDLKKVTVPLLALYGGSDYVVPPRENASKLKAYLAEAGNRDYKVVVFDEADHGMIVPGGLRRLGSGRPESYYWGWRKLAPGLVETTLDWLMGHVRVAR